MTRWQAFRSLPFRAQCSVVLTVFPLVYALLVTKVTRENR